MQANGTRANAKAAMVVGALGVVFGETGTSPIYTIQTVFNPTTRTRSSPRSRAHGFLGSQIEF